MNARNAIQRVWSRRPKLGSGTQTLAAGVIFLAVLTLFQRFVGLGRSVILCRWLPTDELGQWDLEFTFLLSVGPLVVLGIPGAFGRFAESYRQKNQLIRFVQITAIACAAILAASTGAMILFREPLGAFLVNAPSGSSWYLLLIPTLVTVVVFNYLTALMTALRQHRAFAGIQAVHGIAFAALCLVFVPAFSYGSGGVVVAYAVASIIGAAVAAWLLRTTFRELGAEAEAEADDEPKEPLWTHFVAAIKHILPFAVAIWLATLIANSFRMSDRMLMVHLTENEQLAMFFVGQYHAARIIPRLMAQFAMSLAAMVTPHLVQDWDQGNHAAAIQRLGRLLKFVSISFCVAGIGVLAMGNTLFSTLMDGKFELAVELLPWAMATGITFSIAFVAQNAAWCSKQAWSTSACFLVGLIANVLFGIVLFPTFGILGIAVGTFMATSLVLWAMLWLAARAGFCFPFATYVLMALPSALVGGYIPASVLILAIALAAVFHNEFVTDGERQRLREIVIGRLNRFRRSSSAASAGR